MSDNLSKNRWSFEDEITLSQPDLRYAAKNNERKIICAMDIAYPLLKQWTQKLLMPLLQYGKFEELYNIITNWSPEENPTELWIMLRTG